MTRPSPHLSLTCPSHTSNIPEKFETDPKSLQPPEEKHFLNPRLSISTRFLSRFQDRVRSGSPRPGAVLGAKGCFCWTSSHRDIVSFSFFRVWPTKPAPLVSVPAKISEESSISNTSVRPAPGTSQGDPKLTWDVPEGH